MKVRAGCKASPAIPSSAAARTVCVSAARRVRISDQCGLGCALRPAALARPLLNPLSSSRQSPTTSLSLYQIYKFISVSF